MAAATLGSLPFPQAASADSGITIVSVSSQPGDVALIQPTVLLNPAVIDYTDPTVTFTGQVTGISPGETAPEPITQQPVTINGPNGPYTGETDDNGDFQIPATTAQVGDSYQAAVAASPDMAAATSTSVQVTQMADPVQLTASLAKGTVKYGQGDTVSGTVTYQPGSADPAQPLAGVTVTIARSVPAGQPEIKVVTGSQGQYTASIPAQKDAGTWTVRAGGTALLEEAVKSLKLYVRLPTTFRQVKIALSAFRVLTVKACLNVTSPGETRDSVTDSVTLQDERSTKGPWRNLQVVPATEGGTAYCHYGKSSWRATVLAPVANARYRLSFAANQGLQAAATKAVHLWRYPTRITSFKITPRRVAANGVVTISGRLWHDTTSWHPYARHKVAILFRAQGKWYIYQSEPVTNSGGYFSGRFTTRVTAKWLAQYFGDKRDFVSASPLIKVTVTNSAAVPPTRGPGASRPMSSRRVA
jgi:hypothetical protein